MKITIPVTLTIELGDNLPDPKKGDPLYDRMIDSAIEAVETSLDNGAENGFMHDMADISAIEVHNVGPAKVLRR